MEISQYLIISSGKKRWNPIVKLVKKLTGSMPSNSVAIKLNIHLPDSIFEKPQLQATIKIKDEDISKPVITAETLDNIKAEFSKNMAIDMNIQIVEPEKQK